MCILMWIRYGCCSSTSFREQIIELLSWQNHHWQRIAVFGTQVSLLYETLILRTWYSTDCTFDTEDWGVRELQDVEGIELLDLSWITESFGKTCCKEKELNALETTTQKWVIVIDLVKWTSSDEHLNVFVVCKLILICGQLCCCTGHTICSYGSPNN